LLFSSRHIAAAAGQFALFSCMTLIARSIMVQICADINSPEKISL
jgi:hypothetical protein